MKKWRNILSVCLVFQLFLVVAANLAQTDYGTFEPKELLLEFDRKKVDAIHIEQTDNKPLDLKKADGKWQVEALDKFQADQNKVNELLDHLAKVKKGWPVVTTSGAANRFKVAPDNFEHKIILASAGKTLETLFVGTSPSFRKVHVRKKSEDPVYLAKIDGYALDVEPENWIDKDILKLDPSKLKRVILPGFALMHQDKKWTVEKIDSQKEEPVEEEVDRLLDSICHVTIRSVIKKEDAGQLEKTQQVLTYSVELSNGKKETYVFSKFNKDSQEYILKPSHRDQFFKVKNWVADNIKNINRSKIVRKKKV